MDTPKQYEPHELAEVDAQLEALEAADGRTESTLAGCTRLLGDLKDSVWLTLSAKIEIRERYEQHLQALGALRPDIELSQEAIKTVIENKITDMDAA